MVTSLVKSSGNSSVVENELANVFFTNTDDDQANNQANAVDGIATNQAVENNDFVQGVKTTTADSTRLPAKVSVGASVGQTKRPLSRRKASGPSSIMDNDAGNRSRANVQLNPYFPAN